MKLTYNSEFNEQQQAVMRKARIIEILSLLYFGSVIILMYLVMGNSQAMKTTWYEDCLSTIPPLVFLIGASICKIKANYYFPYGFHRIVSIAFLTSALTLLSLGLFLCSEGLYKLLSAEHPSIGIVDFAGLQFWSGWLMIIVLLWGTIPSLFLGKIKIKLAKPINDKVLFTDATLNKDDWLVGLAAIAGIIGIGYGWWWTDGLAALLISLNIVFDGVKASKNAITELMDRTPKNLHGQYSSLPKKILHFLKQQPGIMDAKIRLRDFGHQIFGEGIIVLADEKSLTGKDLELLMNEVKNIDWRINSFIITIANNIE